MKRGSEARLRETWSDGGEEAGRHGWGVGSEMLGRSMEDEEKEKKRITVIASLIK